MRKASFSKLLLYSTIVILITGLSGPLPKLFLVGDSISIQYGPYLEEYLQGVVTYERKLDDGQAGKDMNVPAGANGGDSRMVLEYLRAKFRDNNFRPDYLLINCGLHDIRRDVLSKDIQVGATEYRENLEAIINLARQKQIQLVWIRTTPVVDSIHNSKSRSFHRFSADLELYNQIADEVFSRYDIPAIDLFSFTMHLGEEQFIDHVHFSEPARGLQAAYIAGFIQAYIQKKR
jgi:lysophospholipase L1-like esterase